MRIILITGISGSGKSVALNVLEDAGYYCVDNLPAQFIPELTRYLDSQGYTHLASPLTSAAASRSTSCPTPCARWPRSTRSRWCS